MLFLHYILSLKATKEEESSSTEQTHLLPITEITRNITFDKFFEGEQTEI